MPAPVTLRLNLIVITTPDGVSLKEDVDLRSKSRSANKWAEELKELMEVCCQNILHVEEL